MRLEDKQLYEEARKVKRVAGPYGSAFDQALVDLIEVSDRENLYKIRDAFSEEWAKLLELYRRASEQGRL